MDNTVIEQDDYILENIVPKKDRIIYLMNYETNKLTYNKYLYNQRISRLNKGLITEELISKELKIIEVPKVGFIGKIKNFMTSLLNKKLTISFEIINKKTTK